MRSLVLASIAVAAPVRAGAEACAVTVQAPAEVRAVVDRWVAGEARCGAALEVTIEPAAGGLMLTARDARGGRRVRVVPDAQTAGVLIASWAADDRLDAAEVPGVVSAPGLTAVQSPSPVRPHRRVLVMGMVGSMLGARGEVDVLGVLRNRVVFGLAVDGLTGVLQDYADDRTLQVMEYAGVGHAWSRWQLRAALGVGFQVTQLALLGETGQSFARGTDTLFVTEASATLSCEIGAGFAATAGALVSVLPKSEYIIPDQGVVTQLPRFTPLALLGVSYRL